MNQLVLDSLILYYLNELHAQYELMSINKKFIPVLEAKSSAQLSKWINYQDSLTEKLRKITGSIQLELLAQQWIIPTWWDRYFLDINDALLFEREILMKSHDIAFWYARSIIPQKCHDLDPVFFNRLENESIKNLIFDEVKVQRVNFMTYPVNHQCIEFHWVKKYLHTVQGVFWARLAEFSFLQQESFYLIELLFPELENVR